MIYVFMESAKYEFNLFSLNFLKLTTIYFQGKIFYTIQYSVGIFKGNLLAYSNVRISQILIKPSALICDSCFEQTPVFKQQSSKKKET